VEDGLTGFIVEDEAGAVEAVKQIDRLPRANIRNRFEERFTACRMANEYLRVYQELIEAAGTRPRLAAPLRAVS
jgi:glycosyltransferase involved in cell wall biosynthesis